MARLPEHAEERVVDEDILAVLTHFGCSGICIGDLDGDGSVGISDGLIVLGAFGSFCN